MSDSNSTEAVSIEQSKFKEGGEALVKQLADAILAEQHFALDSGGKIYIYRDGCYRPRGERVIQRKVKHLVIAWGKSERWSTRLADEVTEFISLDLPELWDTPPEDTLNLKNGLLTIANRQLAPHSPSHLSATQLPITYDPAATCPNTEQFVALVFPADCGDLPWEIFAWLMRPERSIQQAILAYGTGGNGKSTWLEQVTEFIGRDNISTCTLQKLECDKFATARLTGKLANICDDLPTEHLRSTAVFKMLVDGRAAVEGEYKFKESFSTRPYARLLFSANEYPKSGDRTDGFFDRWFVIPFTQRLRATEDEIPRDEMHRRMCSAGELSGVLNKALDALPDLNRHKRFTQSAAMKQACQEFRATTDPFVIWVHDNVYQDAEGFAPCQAILRRYNELLKQRGSNTWTQERFGAEFKKLFPTVERGQRTIDDKRVRCYLGIGLRDEETHPAHPAHPYPLSFHAGAQEGNKIEAEHVQPVQPVQRDIPDIEWN